MYEAKCVAAMGSFNVCDLVAIKEIDGKFDSCSLDEANALLTSNSFPNCVKFLKLFVDSESGHLCLVFEHCADGDLLSFLRTRARPIDERLLTSWLVQLLEALVAMEAKGVTHDDIALRNVLLTSTDDLSLIRLADFGLSRFAGSRLASQRELYDSVAPECAAGSGGSGCSKPTPASDAWSLRDAAAACSRSACGQQGAERGKSRYCRQQG